MKNVVVIGGGTGLSTLLRGLKLFPMNITAIVTVAPEAENAASSRSPPGAAESRCLYQKQNLWLKIYYNIDLIHIVI